MDAQLCKYAPGFLLLASLGIGCNDDGTSRSTGNLTSPATVTSSLITVEPAAIRPELLSSPNCGAPPFRTRFRLIFRARRELFLNGFRFEFVDRFGVGSVPISIPATTTGTAFIPVPLPTTSPIPLPGSSPIPIPGTPPFSGLLISPGSSRTLPFLLQFNCGVSPSGTLSVNIDTADRDGTADVARVSVGFGDN